MFIIVFILGGCVNANHSAQIFEYDLWMTKRILWENILFQPEKDYLVYIYSTECGYCHQIKQEALCFYQKTTQPMYVIFDDENITYIPGENMEKMIGIDKVENLALLGVPSLVFVVKAKVAKILVGAKNISDFYSETSVENKRVFN